VSHFLTHAQREEKHVYNSALRPLAAACYTSLACGLAAAVACFPARAEPPAAARAAEPFALQDVRLLDGPFKEATARDGAYLLSLDPDRLLHNFRVNAGLPSSAEPLGNWEKPGCELRGHLTGHALSAYALMYASTGDARFKERADLLVRELATCQAALGPSGYLSAFPEAFFDRLEKDGKVWAPYYTLHKVAAGLLDAHVHCGSPQALEAASKFGDWVCARLGRLSDEQLQKALDTEHGGINESLANLYGLTGQPAFLDAARRLCHRRVLDPLAAGEDRLSGLHANTQVPKLVGAARLYELTGEARYRDMSAFFWDRVANHHSYAIGGNSDHEGFGPPDRLSDRVSPFTAESCNTYNMLKLTRHLFAWRPSAACADFYERALYNHILASQDPRTGHMAYHIPVYGGWFMPYNTANDSCWCCTGTGFENHAKYGDSIYWRDAEGLYVNLFIASELTWREKGVTLRLDTRYPEEESARLTIRCAKPAAFALRLRHPAWARRGLRVTVNGAPVDHGAAPGSFAAVSRTWQDGDRVEMTVPMSLRLEPMPDNPARAALFYGPVILAGELGTNGIAQPMPYAIKQSDFFKSAPPPMPVLLAGARPAGDWIKPVSGRPLTFRTQGVGQPTDVTLTPFYRLAPQRFSLYWDLLTDEQWRARQAADSARKAREQALALRAVDAVAMGDAKSEKAHGLKGEKTKSGTFSSRLYRDASDGGWFSYDLRAPSGQALSLLCTFWGSDAGPRQFDLLANGANLGTVKLSHNRPGEFYDAEFAIPPSAVDGQTTLTVKLQARPENIAGGLFDLRLLRQQDQTSQPPKTTR
jgi:DUF1680 family protein